MHLISGVVQSLPWEALLPSHSNAEAAPFTVAPDAQPVHTSSMETPAPRASRWFPSSIQEHRVPSVPLIC